MKIVTNGIVLVKPQENKHLTIRLSKSLFDSNYKKNLEKTITDVKRFWIIDNHAPFNSIDEIYFSDILAPDTIIQLGSSYIEEHINYEYYTFKLLIIECYTVEDDKIVYLNIPLSKDIRRIIISHQDIDRLKIPTTISGNLYSIENCTHIRNEYFNIKTDTNEYKLTQKHVPGIWMLGVVNMPKPTTLGVRYLSIDRMDSVIMKPYSCYNFNTVHVPEEIIQKKDKELFDIKNGYIIFNNVEEISILQ